MTSLLNHVLEPTRRENVLYNELVDIAKIYEPLGNIDNNRIHFDIKVKSESKNKNKLEKKQGKRSRKKHLSKEAIRKIA